MLFILYRTIDILKSLNSTLCHFVFNWKFVLYNSIKMSGLKERFHYMPKNVVPIMDIDFVNITKHDLLHNDLFPRLANGEKSFVVTANPEFVMKTREDAEFKAIVQAADFVVPDGIGIIKASHWINDPLKERIPGYELMLDLLAHANEQGLSCYFLGAKEEVNEKAVKEVEKRYPNLKVAGRYHGYFDIDDRSIFENVRKTNPDLIFVALGMPRQEKWIAHYMKEFDKGLFMGVGGSFDTLTGTVKRAPEAWIKLNLEWLYRFIKQPIRFKRILKIFEFAIRMRFKRH